MQQGYLQREDEHIMDTCLTESDESAESMCGRVSLVRPVFAYP